MRNTKKGFTLVELLVVIAILAILATVSVVGYTNYIKNANESLALQELSQVKSSILAEDIVNNNFAIGSDGKVNAEGVDAFNAYLEDLANGLNGNLEYVDGTVVYTLEKDTSVVYVLDLKTGEVEAGTATQTPVTPPAGEGEVCESICAECGKCTDANCDDADHTEKCGGHTVAPTTVTVSIADLGTTNGWATGSMHKSFTVDGITFTADGSDSNTGKYYTSGDKSWRFYSTGNATMTIAVPEGKTIKSVTLTWEEGGFEYNGTDMTNGEAMTVSGNEVVLKATAKTFVTSIVVTYQ